MNRAIVVWSIVSALYGTAIGALVGGWAHRPVRPPALAVLARMDPAATPADLDAAAARIVAATSGDARCS